MIDDDDPSVKRRSRACGALAKTAISSRVLHRVQPLLVSMLLNALMELKHTLAPRSYHATTRTRPRCQQVNLERTPSTRRTDIDGATTMVPDGVSGSGT
eukprot:COSAG01_NODE_5477_length_4236_cov_2.696157_3_plen_99_part_00